LFLSGHAVASFEGLERHGLLAALMPETAAALRSNRSGALRRMVLQGLAGTDARVAADEPVSPAFLFALLLWPAYCRALAGLQAQGMQLEEAQRRAADRVTLHQVQTIALPKRFSLPMQEIWLLQSRFSSRQRKRVFRLLAHPRFRAAYDFLVLRLAASESHCRRRRVLAGGAAQFGRCPGRQPRRLRRDRRRGRLGWRAAPPPPPPPARVRRRLRMNTPVRACIGLGANLGEAAATVAAAFPALAGLPGSRLLASSRLYRTPAWGRTDQPDFVNAAVVLETSLPPLELLDALLRIERDAGRVRGGEGTRWGPRVLDLDLLLYGDQVLDLPGLQVPHPYLHQRAFVLVPLAEIAPGAAIPGLGTVADALAAVDPAGVEVLQPA